MKTLPIILLLLRSVKACTIKNYGYVIVGITVIDFINKNLHIIGTDMRQH